MNAKGRRKITRAGSRESNLNKCQSDVRVTLVQPLLPSASPLTMANPLLSFPRAQQAQISMFGRHHTLSTVAQNTL